MPQAKPDEASLDATGETDLRDAADTVTSTSVDVLEDIAKPPGPPTSPIKSIEDLRRLNRRATQEGMYMGAAGGGVLTFLLHRTGMMNKNGLVLTFLLSSTGISFLFTRQTIRAALGNHHNVMAAARAPVAPGGGSYLEDKVVGDAPASAEEQKQDPRSQLAKDLSAIKTVSQPRERTKWVKGRGLDGEVEEEEEMKDRYFRPGVPRV